MPQYLADQVLRMRQGAKGIEEEEYRRYEEGLRPVQAAYDEAHKILSEGIDTDRAYSKAADAIGAQSNSLLEGMRSNLVGRGLSPGSGVAKSMLSKLAATTQGQLIGSAREVAIQNQQQRYVNAAANFANAMNLSDRVMQPVPGAVFENEQNIFEGMLGWEGIQAMKEMAKSAGDQGILSSVIGGGSNILSRLLRI